MADRSFSSILLDAAQGMLAANPADREAMKIIANRINSETSETNVRTFNTALDISKRADEQLTAATQPEQQEFLKKVYIALGTFVEAMAKPVT